MRRPCLMTDYLIVHRAAEAHTKMGNQDKFMHETAILLLIWMYDIRHTRPHVFHHECANEVEEGIMAHVLSDYDMAPASAAWPRVRGVRAGRWHAQPTASRLRGIQVRSRCACAPRISATLSCGAGRSRSGSCAPGLVASICARSASLSPRPRVLRTRIPGTVCAGVVGVGVVSCASRCSPRRVQRFGMEVVCGVAKRSHVTEWLTVCALLRL